MSAVRYMADCAYAEARNLGDGRVFPDFFIADELFAGDDDFLCSNCDVYIVELIADDDGSSVRGCLLNMDDGRIQLRNRKGNYLLARVEGVLNIYELVLGKARDRLSYFLADSPLVYQAGTPREAACSISMMASWE